MCSRGSPVASTELEAILVLLGIALDIVTWGQRFAAKGLSRERGY